MKNKNLYIGSLILGSLLFIMLLSFVWTPYDPYKINEFNKIAYPSYTNFLGTDYLGRDIFSRIMIASQSAFILSTIVIFMSSLIGTLIGLISGYYGGIIDTILMKIVDSIIAIPGILILLMFIAILGKSNLNTVISITILILPSIIRLTRGKVLEIKNLDYIFWAKTIGVNDFRILFVHILPNIKSTIIVNAAMKFSNVILMEAGLSYLGLGVQLPYPSWGMILSESKEFIFLNPFYSIVPGIFITLTALGFNQLGDGVKEILDKRRKNENINYKKFEFKK
ncbi:MAG: ABC transporter permease [Cetobacterium sp.]|uniref:ABC transporter permease n=1 Tax=Cetobacterium sp. TaxID=2071632 RepID=UPI0025D9F06F|nr:ABC transporter permease [uncultured Cetobacterium sp.]